jgi:hypothetical protein
MLYMFQAVPPPIVRSSKLYIQNHVVVKYLTSTSAHYQELKTVYTASDTDKYLRPSSGAQNCIYSIG